MGLPFVTKPKAFTLVKIGSPEIGELEIPKLGDLSVNEKLFIKECLKDLPDLQQLAAGLAQKIAKESGQPIIAIYDALTQGNLEVLEEYLGDALEFNKQFERYMVTKDLAIATAILRRLDPEWTMEQTGEPTELHPELMKEIARFGYNEESGWPEQKEPEPITEELVGKSPEGNTETKSRTGKKSSGSASDSGPTIDDSQPSLLEASPSA